MGDGTGAASGGPPAAPPSLVPEAFADEGPRGVALLRDGLLKATVTFGGCGCAAHLTCVMPALRRTYRCPVAGHTSGVNLDELRGLAVGPATLRWQAQFLLAPIATAEDGAADQEAWWRSVLSAGRQIVAPITSTVAAVASTVAATASGVDREAGPLEAALLDGGPIDGAVYERVLTRQSEGGRIDVDLLLAKGIVLDTLVEAGHVLQALQQAWPAFTWSDAIRLGASFETLRTARVTAEDLLAVRADLSALDGSLGDVASLGLDGHSLMAFGETFESLKARALSSGAAKTPGEAGRAVVRQFRFDAETWMSIFGLTESEYVACGGRVPAAAVAATAPPTRGPPTAREGEAGAWTSQGFGGYNGEFQA